MNRIARAGGVAALALTMSLSIAACGNDADSDSSTGSDKPSASESPMTDETESAAPSAGDEPFGPGCSAVPADGKGSFQGMATDPVATAASNNPVLSTLVSAVTEAGLVDTLNSTEDITVFAPTDDAFAKIPPKQLDKVLKDKKTLTAILTHHVVPGRLSPEDLTGTHDTLNKDQVEVMGSGEEFMVAADDQGTEASVICGNVQTANATVYIVDTVLMPPM